MRLLLDTHTFLWFVSGNPKLSANARRLIEDTENSRALSVASLWEIAIKASIGKLKLDLSIIDLVDIHIKSNAIGLLNISPKHLDSLLELPFHHKDPFDRLIISQGKTENLMLCKQR